MFFMYQLTAASSFTRTIVVIINYSSTSECLYLILNIEKSTHVSILTKTSCLVLDCVYTYIFYKVYGFNISQC